MAQEDTPEIYCVFGPNKEKNLNTCCKFIRSEIPLLNIKRLLDDTEEPHRIGLTWVNRFENVYYSEDGRYWVCKLCIEEKDFGHHLKGRGWYPKKTKNLTFTSLKQHFEKCH